MQPTRSSARGPRLYGVLVTFNRPAALSAMLRCLSDQDRPLDGLVVVDNSPTASTEATVRTFAAGSRGIDYVPSVENIGPAGAVAEGMQRILRVADDRDWIVVLDDGDPPYSTSALEDMLRFGEAMSERDPRTGAIGIVGSRFDLKRGRMIRPTDAQLKGPVSVDVIGGNELPLFRVSAIRDVGSFSSEIFFGFEELEHALRLKAAGYSIYADGDRWRERRAAAGRMGLQVRPSYGLSAPTWRRYYSLRNIIYVLRLHGATRAALRVTLVHGIAKPLANALISPRRAFGHLKMNLLASWHAWIGRMGRTVQPDSGYELIDSDERSDRVAGATTEVTA